MALAAQGDRAVRAAVADIRIYDVRSNDLSRYSRE